MARIYLAGPFFSDEQIDRIHRVGAALTSNPTVESFFSPMETNTTDDNGEQFTPQWANRVFKLDTDEIDKADVVCTVTDFVHQNMDSGTAFEVGYAFATNTPVVCLQELDEPLNLMIGQALRYYTKSVDELASYDFNKLPANQYTGKTF